MQRLTLTQLFILVGKVQRTLKKNKNKLSSFLKLKTKNIMIL